MIEKYDILLCDPPWSYRYCATKSRQIENQYDTMELEDIKKLKVPSADSAILFLWSPAPKLQESLEIMNSWGFTYRTCGVWDKEIIGLGYWFRSQHELLLIGVKGSFPTPVEGVRVSSVYKERRGKHSKKPDYYYDLIEGKEIKEAKEYLISDFIPSLRAAAESLDFTKEEAKKLADSTGYGSFSFLEQSNITPLELRKQVTSKGGKTEAGLEVIHRGGSLEDAAKVALKRAKELSK